MIRELLKREFVLAQMQLISQELHRRSSDRRDGPAQGP